MPTGGRVAIAGIIFLTISGKRLLPDLLPLLPSGGRGLPVLPHAICLFPRRRFGYNRRHAAPDLHSWRLLVTDLTIPVDALVDFLVGLLNTPSPTGYHVEAMQYVEDAFAALQVPGLSTSRTRKGALLIRVAGAASDAPRGLSAHADTLGLMVKEIKPDGRLKLTQLGHFMWNAVEGEGVTVRTADDRRLRGTVLPVQASVHIHDEAGDEPRTEETMEVRLDARTRSADETRALGVEVGDFVFLDPRV